MAVKKVSFLIDVDTKTGEAKIRRFVGGIDKGTVSIKKMNAELKSTSKNMGQVVDKTGLAGAAVVEIGRTISDSNFGLTAMANNLSQLSTLMVTLIATTGGLKKGMQALWSAFKGPLGLIVVFQIVIAMLEKMAIAEKSAARGANEVIKATRNAGTELELLLQLDNTLTDDQIDNTEKRIIALKAEARVRAQIAEVQRLQIKLIKIETQTAFDFVPWYQALWEATKSGDFGFTKSPEFISNVLGIGDANKQEALDKINEDIAKIVSDIDPDALRSTIASKTSKGKKGPKQKWVRTFAAGLFGLDNMEEDLAPLIKTLEEKLADMKILADFNKWLEAEQQRHNDEMRRLDEEQVENKLKLYDAIASGLRSLGFLMGEATSEGKAIAAAGALIDTFAAVTAILHQAGKTAAGGIPGYAIAQAVAAGLFGLATVKKIYDVKVPGQGGGDSSGAGATELPEVQAPDFNIIGGTRGNQIGAAIGKQLDGPIRAYITSKDVRTGAELDRNIVGGARIG